VGSPVDNIVSGSVDVIDDTVGRVGAAVPVDVGSGTSVESSSDSPESPSDSPESSASESESESGSSVGCGDYSVR
jgi:hypothetical protein